MHYLQHPQYAYQLERLPLAQRVSNLQAVQVGLEKPLELQNINFFGERYAGNVDLVAFAQFSEFLGGKELTLLKAQQQAQKFNTLLIVFSLALLHEIDQEDVAVKYSQNPVLDSQTLRVDRNGPGEFEGGPERERRVLSYCSPVPRYVSTVLNSLILKPVIRKKRLAIQLIPLCLLVYKHLHSLWHLPFVLPWATSYPDFDLASIGGTKVSLISAEVDVLVALVDFLGLQVTQRRLLSSLPEALLSSSSVPLHYVDKLVAHLALLELAPIVHALLAFDFPESSRDGQSGDLG